MSTRIPTTPKSGCWTCLSNGHNRFMVGDIKQSIYRFRQADPQIFNDKFKAYQEEGADGELILLKENFRSHVEVLDATNDVFRRHDGRRGGRDSTTIKPTILLQEATSRDGLATTSGRIFAL